MPRARSDRYDVGAAAVGVLEQFLDEELPEDGWRQQLFMADAADQLVQMRARVEQADDRICELEDAEKMLTEDRDEHQDRAETLTGLLRAVETAVDEAKAKLDE